MPLEGVFGLAASPQDAAQSWQNSAGTAQTKYKAGIQSTQKDQAQLAVAAQARLVAGFNDAVSSGRWAAGVMRGGTAYWKQQADAKSGNYATGFTAGAGNYAAAAQKFIPAIQAGVQQLGPRGDINTNLDRARNLALYLHARKGSLGAR